MNNFETKVYLIIKLLSRFFTLKSYIKNKLNLINYSEITIYGVPRALCIIINEMEY